MKSPIRGLGYSAEFTANMAAKIAAIKNGAPVVLVQGPDDICTGMTKACMNATGHDCRMSDILEMDTTARVAVENMLKRNLERAASISANDLKKLRAAFVTGSIREACAGCSWFELCNEISTDGFSGSNLLSAA